MAASHDGFVHAKRAPLFYWPIADVPINEKLARMRETLEAGSDPKEADHSKDPKRQHGRPLHMAISNYEALGNGSRIYDNIPVIKLLLQYRADPRLFDVPSNPHGIGYPGKAVDVAGANFECALKGNDTKPHVL